MGGAWTTEPDEESYPFSSRRGAAAGLWGVEGRRRPPAGEGGAHFPPVLPPQVTPLTALKLAELTLKAGIPKGVINVLPGSGKGRGWGHEVHLVKTACYVVCPGGWGNSGEACLEAEDAALRWGRAVPGRV